mgnify:CR=1 FL=1|jgi:transcriptional regulator with XRE-family HTH domain
MFVNTIAVMKTDSSYISIYRAIGVNAARIRAQKGQSQLFVADRSGVDRSALNKFEGGKYNPSVEWLCKLADGLDVPVVEFFSGLESSAPGKIGKSDRGEAEE